MKNSSADEPFAAPLARDRVRKLRAAAIDAERSCGRDCVTGRSKVPSSVASTLSAPYIVDFFCLEARLVILTVAVTRQKRTRKRICLEAGGYRVLRFWNNDVMSDLEAVLRQIGNSL